MTKDERLQKVMHKIDSAILHMEAVERDTADDEVQYIIGHLKRAQEKVHALNFGNHHTDKRVRQLVLF